jgi:hypothetical protein
MESKEKEVRVFYSWQSDLPDATNRNAIRKSLRAAAKGLSSDIVIDEATRDTSGSPNIPKTIIEKVEAADIFVADITTINGATTAGRKCPNPNVVYELGYAVAILGWERIVLLFNTEYGVFPDDLPFDFDRHRASPFRLTRGGENEHQKVLNKLALVSLDAIIKKNPKRPSELKGLTRAEIEHKRDVENLRWVLSKMHLPTLDEFINELPHLIRSRVFYFYEDFVGVVSTNSLFHLNDKKLWDAFIRFGRAWDKCLSYGGHYHDTLGGHTHIFSNPGDLPLTDEKERVWNTIDRSRRRMRRALDEILKRVRESYLDIDLRKTNAKAHAGYVKFHEDIAA